MLLCGFRNSSWQFSALQGPVSRDHGHPQFSTLASSLLENTPSIPIEKKEPSNRYNGQGPISRDHGHPQFSTLALSLLENTPSVPIEKKEPSNRYNGLRHRVKLLPRGSTWYLQTGTTVFVTV